jgi:hypothetical protein
MFKKYSSSILFVITLIFVSFGFANNVKADAASTFLGCPASNAPLNTEFCSTTAPAGPPAGQRWINNSCKSFSEVSVTINSCQPSKNEVYSCTSNSCVCASGFPIDCRTKTPAACIASAMPANPTCTAAHKTTDQCGECGGCASGYSLVGGICVQNCTDPNEIKAADGTCMSLEKVSKIMVKVFGVPTLGDLMSGFQTIIDNITSNPSYYLLTSQGTSVAPSPFAGQRLYQFGSTGDPGPTPKVRLEADWADGAWLAEYLNWNNEPAKTLLSLLGVTFCDATHPCGAGRTCESGICQGTVALGGACNGITTFCDNAMQCVGGFCVQPAVSGVGKFVGLTTDVTGSYYSGATINSYAKMDEICSNTYAGSHVCTADEMFNSYQKGAVSISAGMGIINNGPPGYTVFANDCNGWKVRTEEYNMTKAFGAVWYFADKKASLVRCDWLADATKTNYKISCCK